MSFLNVCLFEDLLHLDVSQSVSIEYPGLNLLQNCKMCNMQLITIQQFLYSSYKSYIFPGFWIRRLPKLLPSMNNNALRSLNLVLRSFTAHTRFSLSSPFCCLCLWLLCLNHFWSQWGSWHQRPGHPAWKPRKRVYVTITAL